MEKIKAQDIDLTVGLGFAGPTYRMTIKGQHFTISDVPDNITDAEALKKAEGIIFEKFQSVVDLSKLGFRVTHL